MQNNLKNGKINKVLEIASLWNNFSPKRYLDNNMSFVTLPNFNTNTEIREIIKKQNLKYNSFFLCQKIYEEQIQNQKKQIDNKNHETEDIQLKVEKKGFLYCQYQANNPIQDSMVSFEIPQLNAFVVSIFDGHGGPQLSKFCAQNISKILQSFIKMRMKMPKYENKQIQLIKQALISTHQSLEDQFYEIYCQKIRSQKKKYKGLGTCAITLVLLQNKCIVATCGDSQAIMIQDDQGSYNLKKLSERYSVNNKSQRQRLLNQFKSKDKNIVVEQRKNVFYLKGVLQPTKSIGDYYLKIQDHFFCQGEFNGPYLSCEPDIKVFDIQQHDKYIVMASDGLWDYLSKWDVLKYVVQNKKQKKNISQRQTQSQNDDQYYIDRQVDTPTFLCQKILQKVSYQIDADVDFLKKMQSGSRRYYHDDISICLIDIKKFFNNQTKNN